MIRREPAYTLLDEQQVAFNHILGRVRDRQRSSEQTVFLIKGGPGTGKSVIAVNLLAELSAEGFATQHATGSKAFTENLRRVVGPRAAAQFGYFNGFAGAEPQILDAIVCDESHRIRENSNSRFTKKDRRSDLPQVEELMQAAKVSVFFIDDLQVVRPGEVGSSSVDHADGSASWCALFEHELEAQFRCGGSEAFVGWVENTLELRRNQYTMWDPSEEFDFDVVDSPQELEMLIRAQGRRRCVGAPLRGVLLEMVRPASTTGRSNATSRSGNGRCPGTRSLTRGSWEGNPEVQLLGQRSGRDRSSRLRLHGARVRVRLRRA